MINNYKEYVDYLSCHPNMADHEILKLIALNSLDKRFGITLRDVRNDVNNLGRTIKTKTPDKFLGGTPGKAAGRKQYEYLIAQWANAGLDHYPHKLETLYNVNHLGKLGLTINDVVADIKEYRVPGLHKKNTSSGALNNVTRPLSSGENKSHSELNKKATQIKQFKSYEHYKEGINNYLKLNGDRSYLDNHLKTFGYEYGLERINANFIGELRLDVIMVSNHQEPNSSLAMSFSKTVNESRIGEDYEFLRQGLGEAIAKYYSNSKSPIQFRNILWDCFPNNKMEIGIINHLLEYGICEEIGRDRDVDDVLVMRYVDRLNKDYGIEKNIAKALTELWCYEFKKQK